MEEREKLIEELEKIKEYHDHGTKYIPIENLLDFILADRKRIVEPLVDTFKGIKESDTSIFFPCIVSSAKETLKRVGVTI